MTEEDESAMKKQDHIAQTMLRNLEMEWEEQKPIPPDDLSPRLLWLASSCVHASGRLERRNRLLRLMACALEWQVQDEVAAGACITVFRTRNTSRTQHNP